MVPILYPKWLPLPFPSLPTARFACLLLLVSAATAGGTVSTAAVGEGEQIMVLRISKATTGEGVVPHER